MLSDYTHSGDLVGPGIESEVLEDADGFSAVVVWDDEIPVHLWQQAHDDHGVTLILDGRNGHAVSVEEFVEEREEILTRAAYKVTRWREGEFPTLREYLGAPGTGTPEGADDPSPTKSDLGTFVHLHTHTEYSPLDGLSLMEEVFDNIEAQGGKAVGSCDHGNCAGHPEQQALADKYGIKPIFGMEAYFQPDRFRRTRQWVTLDGIEVDPATLSAADQKKVEKASDSDEARWGYNHLSLWAMDQNGLRNLWAMSTEAYRDGLFDGKPRLDWDTLDRLGAGVICGTGCLRGPVARAIVNDDMDGARDALMRLAAIFGDRLYVEIHCNTLDDQKKANEGLIRLAREYGLPLMMAVDSHYPTPDKKPTHDMWVAMQQGKSLAEPTGMFEGDQQYHLMTEAEVRALVSYLPQDVVDESIANTVVIADRCTAEVRGETKAPIFHRKSVEHDTDEKRRQRDVERMMEICIENFERRTKGKSYSVKEAMDRLEREAILIIAKEFPGYFLIVADYVGWAKRQGCLVGPSRGSGGGSFIAYLMDITETDPIENDLIFERFLTEGRTELPDFDIDFPTSWRGRITHYITDRWGEDHVSNIGTISRLRTKAAINDVIRTLHGTGVQVPDHKEAEALKKLVEQADAPLAGKHMPWEEVCAEFSDVIDPLRTAYPEFFDRVDEVVDRLKTYGKHAAGIVISPDAPLTDLPMFVTTVEERIDGKKVKTQLMLTQFDMNALALLGYVKFDILTLRTLDTLQAAVDLIVERTGRRINPYDWQEEFKDPQVWEQVAEGRTLGLFQVETAGGTRMTRRMAPSSLEDMAAIVTVVRPGPMRSGLTDSFLRRRAGIEPVSYPDPRMENFVGNTYGAMIYQEQVMACCMQLAGYDSNEADAVRSILGKKKVEKIPAAGREFVARAVENGTDQAVADLLWNQMAEFAKYGFNRAHAFAYAVVGYWTAWLKFHFPVEFLMACMSTVDADRIPEFIDECRQMGYFVRPPDINHSIVPFSSDGLEVVWGLFAIKGIGESVAEWVTKHQPYADLNDFTAKCIEAEGSPVNRGHLKTLVEVGAFDQIVENRRAVEVALERESSGEAKRCAHRTEHVNPEHPFGVPCGFDWANEPDPPMIRKRIKITPEDKGTMETVPKDPPKKCSISCRQYTLPVFEFDSVAPYTMDEIVARERELLGVWVSASPWDKIDPGHLDRSDTASQIENGPVEQEYLGVCMVEHVKMRKDVNGNDYCFVTLNMQDGRIEPVCFSSVYGDVGRFLVRDAMGVAVIRKTGRGTQLIGYNPYPTRPALPAPEPAKEIA